MLLGVAGRELDGSSIHLSSLATWQWSSPQPVRQLCRHAHQPAHSLYSVRVVKSGHRCATSIVGRRRSFHHIASAALACAMATQILDSRGLEAVFSSRPDIISRIRQEAGKLQDAPCIFPPPPADHPDTPARIDLFNDITALFADKALSTQEPFSKRRRFDGSSSLAASTTTTGLPDTTDQPLHVTAGNELILLEIRDISVAMPQRKKFDLCFTHGHLYARVPGTTTPVPGMVYRWDRMSKLCPPPIYLLSLLPI